MVGCLQNDVSVGASKSEGIDSDDATWQRSWFGDDLIHSNIMAFSLPTIPSFLANLQSSISQRWNVLVRCVEVKIGWNRLSFDGKTDLGERTDA